MAKKRKSAKSKKSGSPKRKSAKRVEAGKKAARTRKRREKMHTVERSSAGKAPRRSRARRKSSRKSGSRKASRKPRKRARLMTVEVPRSRSSRRSKSRKSGTTKRRAGKRKTARKTPGVSTARAAVSVNVREARETGAAERRRRGGSRKRRSSHRRRSARESGYVMENPVDLMQGVGGFIALAAGALAESLFDSYLATHALTAASPATDSAGNPLYIDPMGATGTSYAGLYNATAILAPMDMYRWLAGGAMTLVPFGLAYFIKNPAVRNGLQFFGFGAGAAVAIKGGRQLLATVLQKNATGQRLLDGEMRAGSLKLGTTGYPLTSLPGSGLGRAPQLHAHKCGGCANCKTGVGSCCGSLNPGGFRGNGAPPAMNPPASSPSIPPSTNGMPASPGYQYAPGPVDINVLPLKTETGDVVAVPVVPTRKPVGVAGAPRHPTQWGHNGDED